MIRPFVPVVVAGLLVLGGCAGTNIKKEAFSRSPRLAVVTITGGAHGMFTTEDEDNKLLIDGAPACLTELAKSRDFRLLPAKAAPSTRAYAAIKNEGARLPQILLPDYKEFDKEKEKKNLQALAKELGADGFMLLDLVYEKVSGASVSIGFISVGAKKPAASVVITAFTPDGEITWQGRAQAIGDEGIATVNMIGSYSQLLSQMKGLTQKACQRAINDLREQISAK